METGKTEREGKLGFDCLPLTRSGERVFIRECSRDKYSTIGVSSRENESERYPADDRPARR